MFGTGNHLDIYRRFKMKFTKIVKADFEDRKQFELERMEEYMRGIKNGVSKMLESGNGTAVDLENINGLLSRAYRMVQYFDK